MCSQYDSIANVTLCPMVGSRKIQRTPIVNPVRPGSLSSKMSFNILRICRRSSNELSIVNPVMPGCLSGKISFNILRICRRYHLHILLKCLTHGWMWLVLSGCGWCSPQFASVAVGSTFMKGGQYPSDLQSSSNPSPIILQRSSNLLPTDGFDGFDCFSIPSPSILHGNPPL